MQELIKGARERAGLTQEPVARALHMSLSNYRRYENGELPLNTEIVVKLSKILNCSTLTMVWCRKGCDIGRIHCYEILNNVDYNPLAILTKYRQENGEFNSVLDRMAGILLNKRGAEDCTDEELAFLWEATQEMLDEEHTIETMKLALEPFLDMQEAVREHNRKCLERGYVDRKKSELQIA